MKAMILAAGLGTRLRPWTLSHPKALVPVGGVPMLEKVIVRLREQGFDNIVINVHHFAQQVIDYLKTRDFGVNIRVSDESGSLLDTGGGILQASALLGEDNSPFLVHNVDILSDAPLADLMQVHEKSGRDISLVTSGRDSSRKLVFNQDGKLCGWKNLQTGELRPEGFALSPEMHDSAFSGIYILNAAMLKQLGLYSSLIGSNKFPVMDFFLNSCAYNDSSVNIGEIRLDSLHLIDIGKPDTLRKAETDQW